MDGFETLQAARDQQRKRVLLLRRAASEHPADLDPGAVLELANSLRPTHSQRTRQRCSSGIYVRGQCRRVTGALMRFVEGSGARGTVASFHIWTRAGRARPDDLSKVDAAAMLNRLRSAILRAGKLAGDRSGWLICFIDGEFEPITGLIRLHFHGIGSGPLIDAIDSGLRKASDYDLPRAIEVNRDLRSLGRAITYTMKRYWKSVRRPEGEAANRHTRIPEPVHSQVLLWLDRYELDDLCLKIGIQVSRSGRFVRTHGVQ